jgi:branched-chain amino acid transport system substrate-binding protein
MVGRIARAAPLLLALALLSGAAEAQKKYGPGVSDGEIRIGQTMPYSGPASAYGTIGRSELAYFAMINAEGGVNRREITMITLDDALSPPNAAAATMSRART